MADAIHEQDQAAASQSEAKRTQRINLPLSQIYPRAEDNRPLRDAHVKDLAESIGALELIEPLVVDTKGVLLAGGYRLAAIQLLKKISSDFTSNSCLTTSFLYELCRLMLKQNPSDRFR